ncbi:MAG TPA: hypothetical protein VG895_02005 [Patescibacteria group bacterium]|nr:hypothetical protein [Patescibacteria group bacterium]
MTEPNFIEANSRLNYPKNLFDFQQSVNMFIGTRGVILGIKIFFDNKVGFVESLSPNIFSATQTKEKERERREKLLLQRNFSPNDVNQINEYINQKVEKILKDDPEDYFEVSELVRKHFTWDNETGLQYKKIE